MKNFLFVLVSAIFLSVSAMAQPTPKVQTVAFKTSAKCGMCKSRIERDMSLQKGVESASLDLDSKVLTVTYKTKKTDADKLKKAVTQIGYDADELVADKKAHDKLPDCCQKGAAEHKD